MGLFTIFLGILITIIGVSYLFMPGVTFSSFSLFIGLILLISGINAIISYFALKKKKVVNSWDLAVGLISTIFAILLIINQNFRFFAESILIYLFAGSLLIGSIAKIVIAFDLKNEFSDSNWLWSMIVGIVGMMISIYFFIHPTLAAVTIGILVSLYVIMIGCFTITFGALMSAAPKTTKKKLK